MSFSRRVLAITASGLLTYDGPVQAENWIEVYSPRYADDFTGYIDRQSIKMVQSRTQFSVKIIYQNDKKSRNYSLVDYLINCEDSTYYVRRGRDY